MASDKGLIERDSKGLWVKGQSGNPKGRSTRTKETRYLQIMHDVVNDETWAKICARAAKDALDGSHPARKWLGDYMVGPPIKQSELVVSGDVSLSGPSLDRRVKQIMAVFAAVLVAPEGERMDEDPIAIDSGTDSDIIDGVIIEQSIESEEIEESE